MSEISSSSKPFWLKWLIYIGLSLSLLAAIGLSSLLWYFGRDLPDYTSLDEYTPPQMTKVLDREGIQLGRFFKVRRTVVPFSEISKSMIQALLSAEDADFYTHQGLDYWGMLRAIYNSLRAGRLKGSGSTITQQTVKNILLTQEKTLARKVKEMILTRRIESTFSKDDILSMYLNTIYFGHGRYGIEEAALYYFGVHAKELSISQSAMLAGLIQSPERHSPRKHPQSALYRRGYVLSEMSQNGYISEEEFGALKDAPLGLAPKPKVSYESAQWWVQHVGSKVSSHYGEIGLKTGGLSIKTTLDRDLQEAAQTAVQVGLRALDKRQGLDRPLKTLSAVSLQQWLNKQKTKLSGSPPPLNRKTRGVVTEINENGDIILSFGIGQAVLHKDSLDRLSVAPRVGDLFAVYLSFDGPRYPQTMRAHLYLPQAALVALDPHTREVLAMVGGYRFSESSFNRATQAKRQPGSSFKPFVYGAALESKRFTLASVLLDTPETWSLGGGQRWTPKNYTGQFIGPVLLQTALAKSINSVAVRLADAVGLDKVTTFAQRVGLREAELVDNLTLALGSSELSLLELVNAYATFAADGGYADPRVVTEVQVNPVSALKGQKHNLDWPAPNALTPELSEDVAWLIQRLLREVVTDGSGRRLLSFKGEVIGKTGTSNEAKDAWFVGSLPHLTFGVWVGYDAPLPLGKKEGGGRSAAPIILEFLNTAKWSAGQWRDQPELITKANVNPVDGLLAEPHTAGAKELYFLKGTEPTSYTSNSERNQSKRSSSSEQFLFGGGE